MVRGAVVNCRGCRRVQLCEGSPEPLDLAYDGRVLGPRLGWPPGLVGVVVREEPAGFGIVRQAAHDLVVPDVDHDDAPVPAVSRRGVDEDRGSVRYRRFHRLARHADDPARVRSNSLWQKSIDRSRSEVDGVA